MGLGIVEEVTSPTYNIISEYEGVLKKNLLKKNISKNKETVRVYHIDAYRLKGNDDFTAIGGEDIIYGDGISVIEWSDRIPDFISPLAIKVDIEINEGEKRFICIYRGKEPPAGITPMEHE